MTGGMGGALEHLAGLDVGTRSRLEDARSRIAGERATTAIARAGPSFRPE